jgi:chemotaxis protein methyltransferase CheR
LESRLLPVARRNGLANLGELVARLKGSVGSPLTTAVVEAMTTNETYFFRDKIPFDHLRDTVVPSLIASRATNKRIRIWCTAASSGQEPYSIAMVLKSMAAQLRGYRIDLLATDLSGEVLDRAKNGVFSQFEVQRGLPIQLLVRYFSKAGDNWQIAPEIRDMVQFRTLNLLNDFSPLGQFDLIFCRNVLIYFDQPSKIAVLDRLARQIPDDGFLILGAAETVVGLTDRFKPLADRRGLFAPNPQARYQTTRSALNA